MTTAQAMLPINSSGASGPASRSQSISTVGERYRSYSIDDSPQQAAPIAVAASPSLIQVVMMRDVPVTVIVAVLIVTQSV